MGLVCLPPACGKKTNPLPYSLPDEGLKKIEIIAATFKSDYLLITWKRPALTLKEESPVSQYLIGLKSWKQSCFSCSKAYLWTNEIGSTSGLRNEGSEKEGKQILNIGKNQISLAMESTIWGKWTDLGPLAIEISYRLANRRISKSSSIRIYPPVKSIPLPKINSFTFEHTSFNGSRIVVEWDPVLEIRRHLVDSSFVQVTDRYYTINVYRPEAKINQVFWSPINSRPQQGGRFEISSESKTLFASHVDRFGNESVMIPIPINP